MSFEAHKFTYAIHVSKFDLRFQYITISTEFQGIFREYTERIHTPVTVNGVNSYGNARNVLFALSSFA